MKTSVRVQLTIEVWLDDVWGDDCTIKQLRSQAKTAALAEIDRVLVNSNGAVIGEQTVSVYAKNIS